MWKVILCPWSHSLINYVSNRPKWNLLSKKRKLTTLPVGSALDALTVSLLSCWIAFSKDVYKDIWIDLQINACACERACVCVCVCVRVRARACVCMCVRACAALMAGHHIFFCFGHLLYCLGHLLYGYKTGMFDTSCKRVWPGWSGIMVWNNNAAFLSDSYGCYF